MSGDSIVRKLMNSDGLGWLHLLFFEDMLFMDCLLEYFGGTVNT